MGVPNFDGCPNLSRFSLGRPAARGGIDHRRLISPIRSAWRRRNRAHRRCFIDDGLGIVHETAKSFSGFFERVPDERLVRLRGHNAPFSRSLCQRMKHTLGSE